MHTQRYDPAGNGAILLLLENGRIRICPLEERAEWAIGRYDPSSPEPPQIMFQSRIVSRMHGWIRNIDGEWYYVEEPKNLNGTFYNGEKIPKSRNGQKHPVLLEPGDVLRIDNEDLDAASDQGVLILFTDLATHGVWTMIQIEPNQIVTIGRDPECTIVEAKPYVSAHHAEIREMNGQYLLSDCKSKEGTFLNGQPISKTVRLREKDCVTICGSNYFFINGGILYSAKV